ncbi:unnamed protein product [Rotaria sp. Silwood2]|nr:unnamed protein product [Rotaria sp. Silwood2]CAF3043446.1 unnamed protein product [Rotaria sp. Silwood2]CAF4400513.1 unnamed protein product [Rotaria sp. Silwood2]CAF4453797.1 unnamed protein product [Rotaria sp. Silwood2]
MSPVSVSISSINSKQTQSSRNNRFVKSLPNGSSLPDQLFDQLLKFRVDGRTINARNVDELYPGLDRLLLRSLQTGDCRQLYNRLKRNLKPQYLLITGKHIHISVCSQTQNILEKLVEMGATLDLHFYEPIHLKELELMCQYGFDINERLPKYHNQTPLSILINKRYSKTMLNTLIKNGARFDLKDNHGQTCLHHVCQTSISDTVFDLIVEHTPDSCINIQNQFGGTSLDIIYLTAYEQASTSQMRRLHVLLSRKESKLTRYGMREPNLVSRMQHKLIDILSCKEFLFKYRLTDVFDPTIRPLTWCIFLFYDVLRACEKQNTSLIGQITIKQRLERYFISMIENGEIPLDKLIFRSNTLNLSSSSSSSSLLNEYDQKMLTDTENSLLHMTQIKIKLSELRTQTLTLKAICRIKIKNDIRTFPNDIITLNTISKFLQAYLTFYNPFIKTNATDTI